jgi:hypothetical protein
MHAEATVRTFPAIVPPDPPLDTARVVARLDEATHGHWTFEVDYYEVFEKDLVVMGRLTVEDRIRVAFGGTQVNGTTPMAERFRLASLDALVKAAALAGIVVADPILETQVTTSTAPANDNSSASGRISSKQLSYLLSLARDRHIPRDQLAARCLKQFKKKPEYLSKAEASTLIEELKEDSR